MVVAAAAVSQRRCLGGGEGGLGRRMRGIVGARLRVVPGGKWMVGQLGCADARVAMCARRGRRAFECAHS